MMVFKLDDMVKGWFVGNFVPTALSTNQFEVAVKKYKEGDYEVKHYHKVATEITVIVSGAVKMNNIVYQTGQIIVIKPKEPTDFLALTDVITTVVKIPSISDDKYIGDPLA